MRQIQAICFTLAFSLAAGAAAGDEPKDGLGKLFYNLGRGGDAIRAEAREKEEARRQEEEWRQLQLDAARRGAEDSKEELRRQQITFQLRDQLFLVWKKSGYPEKLALAVAQSYNPAPDDDAILESVRLDGLQKGAADAMQAMKDRRYQLADQLMLACLIIANEQAQAEAAATKNDQKAPAE